MAKQWYDAKMQKPPKDPKESFRVHNSDRNRSTKVIVLLKLDYSEEGYGTHFGCYNYDLQEWQIENMTSNQSYCLHVIAWCFIPEFTGEIKTIIKTLIRETTTTAKKTSETY